MLCALFISSQAQEKDSVKISKNEIGINLVPAIALFGGSLGYNINNKLQYKRRINSKYWYKASIGLITNRNTMRQFAPDYKIVSETDTTRSIVYSFNNIHNQFYISQGIEYRFGLKKIKQFIGVDLGYARSSGSDIDMFGVYKKTYYSSNNTQGGSFSFKDRVNQTDSTITSSYTTTNSIVITPFYGARFNITNRLLFSMQIGFHFGLGFDKRTYLKDNTNENPDSERFQSFDFSTTNLLNDFSLVYRF